MQPDHDAATYTAVCLWCTSEYLKIASRARETGIFCSKKCEFEARFWLHDVLQKASK